MDSRSRVRCLAALLLGGAWLVGDGPACSTARADVVELKSGGVIEGVRLEAFEDDSVVVVQTLKSKTPLKLPRDLVKRIVPRPHVLEDYPVLLEKAGEDAMRHFELGLWCEARGAMGLAEVHWNRAIEIDPNLVDAHKKLGHVEIQGQWMNRDEALAAEGYVKHKGRWISPEEKERLETINRDATRLHAWTQQVQALNRELMSGDPARSRSAERAILTIKDPLAVDALKNVLSRGNAEQRRIYYEALGNQDGPTATKALLDAVYAEAEEHLWNLVFELLAARSRDDPGLVKALRAGLRSKDQGVRNRAARGLGRLRAESAVPDLIDALISVERRTIMTQEPVPAGSASGVAGLPGGFAVVSPVVAAGPNGGQRPSVADQVGRVTTFGQVGYAVGPGMVVPFPMPATFGLGVQAAPPRTQPALRVVQLNTSHPEVLNALKTITGRDFGFNQAAWKQWLQLEYKPTPLTGRVVPEP